MSLVLFVIEMHSLHNILLRKLNEKLCEFRQKRIYMYAVRALSVTCCMCATIYYLLSVFYFLSFIILIIVLYTKYICFWFYYQLLLIYLYYKYWIVSSIFFVILLLLLLLFQRLLKTDQRLQPPNSQPQVRSVHPPLHILSYFIRLSCLHLNSLTTLLYNCLVVCRHLR